MTSSSPPTCSSQVPAPQPSTCHAPADIEKSPTINGYSRLASLMGPHPAFAIYRRFGTLNARNLLMLQAELRHLELQLDRCTKADVESGDRNRASYDLDWRSLSMSTEVPEGNPEQWRTLLTIREKLKEYNEALFMQTMLAKEKGPAPQDLEFLRTWMKRMNMGGIYLLGPDADTYEDPDKPDLIAIQNYQDHSRASRFIGDKTYYWWQKLLSGRRKSSPDDIYNMSIHYTPSTLARIGVFLGTVCASTLPVLAIVILYLVSDIKRRLAIIAAFTALFSAVLGTFSSGTATEVFSATAAFAAVQVVFVGTNIGGCDK